MPNPVRFGRQWPRVTGDQRLQRGPTVVLHANDLKYWPVWSVAYLGSSRSSSSLCRAR